MKKCIDCGTLLDANVKFCSVCGIKQPASKINSEAASFSASVGDKNVISGNIIGKNEEYNISGPTTINKIEDETRRFIVCAVSGKQMLRGRDDHYTCPECKKEVYVNYYNFSAKRCNNCVEFSHKKYVEVVKSILLDGAIGDNENRDLDTLAENLNIDPLTKARLESEVNEKFKINKVKSEKKELSGFYKIEIQKIKSVLYNLNDYDKIKNKLTDIYKHNLLNDDVCFFYFLTKSIFESHKYEFHSNEIEKESSSTAFWRNYWKFLALLNLNKPEAAFKTIEENKISNPKNINDFKLGESISYIKLYNSKNETTYISEAKVLYSSISEELQSPLKSLNEFIRKYLNVEVGVLVNYNEEELFYKNNLIGSFEKSSFSVESNQKVIQNSINTNPMSINIKFQNIDIATQMMGTINNAMQNFSAPKFNNLNVPLPKINNKEYFFLIGNSNQGPFSEQQIIGLIKTSQINKTTLIWYKDLKDWKKAEEHQEFYFYFNQ
jgi:hypothetical protein